MRLQKKLIIIILTLMILPFAFAGTTFFDNPDEAFIMDNIVLPPPIAPPTPGGGGGGGGTTLECIDDSGCDLGESCFANTCQLYIRQLDKY